MRKLRRQRIKEWRIKRGLGSLEGALEPRAQAWKNANQEQREKWLSRDPLMRKARDTQIILCKTFGEAFEMDSHYITKKGINWPILLIGIINLVGVGYLVAKDLNLF